VLIVMHERAVVHCIGEYLGLTEHFVHYRPQNTPVSTNTPL
jgi:hypothetical protein